MVVHVWNPSYLQGRSKRNMDWRLAWASWWICLKIRKIFKPLIISTKMENPTPLCFPPKCKWITYKRCKWSTWRLSEDRKASDIRLEKSLASSRTGWWWVPCLLCVLWHVLRESGSWRSPWMWKKWALRASLPSGQRSQRRSTCQREWGELHEFVLFLPNPKS